MYSLTWKAVPRQGGSGSTVDPFLLSQAVEQVQIQEQTLLVISLSNEDQRKNRRAHMTVDQSPFGFHHELPGENLQEQGLL